MKLTKTTVVDLITIAEDGTITFREVTRIIENGNKLSQSFHRASLVPGSDLSAVPDKVSAIANVVWTDDVLNSYAARMAESITTVGINK